MKYMVENGSKKVRYNGFDWEKFIKSIAKTVGLVIILQSIYC